MLTFGYYFVYISDRMFNSLLSTNCFDELFAVVLVWYIHSTDRILIATNSRSTNCFDVFLHYILLLMSFIQVV